MSTSPIQWYPGHIAKAEKELIKNLSKVDLILEVRDARIPLSTSHPSLNKWIHNKKHLLVVNRLDMIPKEARYAWDEWFRKNGQSPWWCNAKTGTGVKQLLEAAKKAGSQLNERRRSRGMLNRPIRALTLGFPNVGKSALINRLVKKKVVESARKAGVTRALRWVRVSKELDLLDAPGVLPSRLENEKMALKLAFCDDIGQGAYEVEPVAIAFLNLLQSLESNQVAGIKSDLLLKRYGICSKEISDTQTWLMEVSKRHTSGNTLRMSQRILDDFRKAFLGLIALELP